MGIRKSRYLKFRRARPQCVVLHTLVLMYSCRHSSHMCSRAGGRLFGGRSARSRWELKMRDRVFLQGRVTVVAILFRSVLTAHALFHTNEDPMRVLMLNPPPPPPCPPELQKSLPWIGLMEWVVFRDHSYSNLNQRGRMKSDPASFDVRRRRSA